MSPTIPLSCNFAISRARQVAGNAFWTSQKTRTAYPCAPASLTVNCHRAVSQLSPLRNPCCAESRTPSSSTISRKRVSSIRAYNISSLLVSVTSRKSPAARPGRCGYSTGAIACIAQWSGGRISPAKVAFTAASIACIIVRSLHHSLPLLSPIKRTATLCQKSV